MPDWTKPAEVDDITLAFPASVVGTLLPPMAEIPEMFHEWRPADPDARRWTDLADTWFALGLNGYFVPKEGIDSEAARRHLRAVMGSFEPKHEHKIAGVAWLMSLWFERFEEQEGNTDAPPD